VRHDRARVAPVSHHALPRCLLPVGPHARPTSSARGAAIAGRTTGSSPVPRTVRARSWRRDVVPSGSGSFLSALYFRIDGSDRGLARHGPWLSTSSIRLVEALRLFRRPCWAVELPELCRRRAGMPTAAGSSAVTLLSVVVTLVCWLAAGPLVAPPGYGQSMRTAFPASDILLASFPLIVAQPRADASAIGWNGHRA